MLAEKVVGTVLVVDDDETQRMLAEQFLAEGGFDCVLASDGEEALQCFRRSPPDLVLLDVRMPGMDGFEVCERIRGLSDGEALPIVMVTGLDDIESIEKSFVVGATDFITKPVVWETLCHRVRYQMRAGFAIQAVQDSERQLLRAQQVARMVHWEWDVTSDQLAWSDSARSVFGVAANSDWGDVAAFLKAVHPDDRHGVSDSLRSVSSATPENDRFAFEHRLCLQGGGELIIEQQGEILEFSGGIATRVVGTARDISGRRRNEERIHQLAYYDVLTALPNRELFRTRAKRAIATAEGNASKLALVFLDLDGFKLVNDTYGHGIGDELLRVVAERLQNSLRDSDVVAKLGKAVGEHMSVSRLGGDEFTILLSDAPSITVIVAVVERLLECLREPAVIDGMEFVISGSAGVAIYPDDGASVDALLKNADIAMYEAKKLGRDGYSFYARHMDELIQQRLTIGTRLTRALEGDQLSLHYQPKIDLLSRRVVGTEALLRWHDPELGPISPADFIPIAEERGLINEIGARVLDVACRQAAIWQGNPDAPKRIAINLSGHQLRSRDFIGQVRSRVEAAGIDPSMLEFELTESLLISRTPETMSLLQELKEMGIALSVDDFGTGYSSLAYLKDFPLDTIKIDRAFVQELSEDPSDSIIVRAIVGLAQSLSMRTVAEGVETAAQLRTLRQFGCDEAQGYFFCKPLEACEVERLFPRTFSGDETGGGD